MQPMCPNEQQAAADRLATFSRIRWRDAVAGFACAAVRLHRYRDLRLRALAASEPTRDDE